jgi:ATP-binding cassette subfamily C (CFTR/MRP) protein 5
LLVLLVIDWQTMLLPDALTLPLLWAGLLLAGGITLSEALRSLFANLYWFSGIRIGVRFRATMFAVVYHRVLRLRNLSGYAVGELVNLSSNDGQRLYDAATLFSFVFITLLLNLCVVVANWWLVGPWALIGSLVYFLVIPLQVGASLSYLIFSPI